MAMAKEDAELVKRLAEESGPAIHADLTKIARYPADARLSLGMGGAGLEPATSCL
jgi:hypothetical protein